MWSSSNARSEIIDVSVSREMLEDFIVEFGEIHHQCESVLMKLERAPEDRTLLDSLFRFVHTAKGNLSFVFMNDYMPLLQNVEDVLDEVRNGRIGFDDTLSDVVLLSMDAVHRLVCAHAEHTSPPMTQSRFDEICKTIQAIIDHSDKRDDYILRAIQLLDPETIMDDSLLTATADIKKIIASVSGVEPLLASYGIKLEGDLAFFYSLIEPMESRFVYWVGRTERQLSLALVMNEQAGRPVDPTQLAAAVFIHDIGMAFLPLEMLHKRERYTEEENRLMRSHPVVGVELLGRMASWRPAADMVLQHHERCDGSGYPQGLLDQKICDGAKILGIIETFDARTHERSYRTLTKRPFIRAVLEINSCSGQLFSERWVEVFNEAVRLLHGAE